jgi:CMP-N,N'-diacetyllegionaminic acid synthase
MLGLVTARGGSQGVPHKNIRPVAGKPLIVWTALAARSARSLARTVLSTDSPEIAEVGRQCGLEVPFLRPPELAGPSSAHMPVVLHALDWLEQHEGYRPDHVVLLQPTSPLRSASDIDRAAALAVARAVPAVVSVTAAASHPYLTYKVAPDGTLEAFVASDIPYKRRQDLPRAVALNGAVYVARLDVLREHQTFLPPGTLAYEMPPERSLDVDTPWDLHLVDLVLRDIHRHENE